MQGDKDGPPDFASAFELLIEEADTGNALAMADLGRMYQDGLGRESDPELAREWYAKALAAFLEAEKSSPNRFTQYRIGWMLLHGVGTERDEAAALPWLEKAAEGGNSFAKYQLGKLLLTGTDAVAKDTERALKLLTECAEDGSQYAQYTLGKAYLLGRDLPQDQGQAVRWLKLSAGQGNQYARFFLDRVYGSIFSSTASLLYHMGRVFQEQRPPLGCRRRWTASSGGKSGRRRSPWGISRTTTRIKSWADAHASPRQWQYQHSPPIAVPPRMFPTVTGSKLRRRKFPQVRADKSSPASAARAA